MSNVPACNPFDYLVDPKAVIEQLRQPGGLQRLVSHVYRPLERTQQRRSERAMARSSAVGLDEFALSRRSR